MTSQGTVRVLVLDEQEVVRRGVRQVLTDDPSITVVAEAASVAEAMARGLALRPDVAVVDMSLPDGSGTAAWARLRRDVSGLRCLVLSAYCDPATVQAAVSLGVTGYLVKHVRGPALVAAVHRVAVGGTVFSPEVEAAVSGSTDRRPGPLDRLTPRERELLRLLGEGLTNRQIAERAGLAEKTVKNYIGGLLGKLGLQRRTQAAVLATELRDELMAAGQRSTPVGRPAVPSRPGRVVALSRESRSARKLRADRRDAYESLPTDDGHWQRAFDTHR